MSEFPLTPSYTKLFQRARDDANRSLYALYGYATKDQSVTLANALRHLSEVSAEIADKLEEDDDDE